MVNWRFGTDQRYYFSILGRFLTRDQVFVIDYNEANQKLAVKRTTKGTGEIKAKQ